MTDHAASGVSMAHPRRLFVSGSFAVLEAAAVELLRTLKAAGDPLAPLWVIVPTNLLRLHLARRAAEQGPGHANLRLLTLLDLARELAKTSLSGAGATEVPDLAATALVRRLMSQHPGEYFAALAHRPGFHAALLATFNDLADGEVDPHTLREFVGIIPPDSGGAAKLDALATLYAAYRRELRRLGLYDRNDLLATAAARAAMQPPPGRQIVLYGFYDLTPLQRRVVAAATHGASAVAFVPWENGPRFAYASETFSWFRSQGFEVSVLDAEAAMASDLARAHARLFDAASDAGDNDVDGSLTVVSAPGEGREVREIARAVWRLVRDRGLRFDEIGVLLRAPHPYSALIAEVFPRCGIPIYRDGGRPLVETRGGRALVLLLRAVQEDFARGVVIEFLTTAPIPFAALLADGARCTPAQWDVFSAEAGIVAGRAQWTARLAALERRYQTRQREDEESPPWLATRLSELDRCRRFIERFTSDAGVLAERRSWRALVDAVLNLFDRYVERSQETEQVRAAISPLAQLDAVAGDASLADLTAAVAEALDTAREPAGSFGHGVFVGDIMPARGLSFRAVIIPGLVERGIPRPVREDPLLLDDERVYLGERSGRLVAPKQRGFDEERLLFTLMLRSARDAVVLSYPRLDMATARDRLPSFFLLHVFSAVSGRPASYREFDRWNRVQRIALSRLFPPSGEEAVDRVEMHLAHADAAVRTGSAAPLSPLLTDAPFFRAAARAEAARWSIPAPTPYDGALTTPQARERLAARDWTLSARRIQRYLQCPYGLFLEQVLGIEALEEPERVRSISALDRGNLVHGILCEFYRRANAAGMVPLRPGDQAGATALIEEVAATQCAEFEAEGQAGLPLLWQREQRVLRETLREFVAREIDTTDEFTPAHFEYHFGDGDRIVHLRLPSGEAVRLRGRVDRIDVAADRRGRVIDYKTGKPSAVAEDAIAPETVQLPLYLHAMRTLFPEHRWEQAELYYVSAGSRFTRAVLSASAPAAQEAVLARLIDEVLRGIRSGWFVAGATRCAYCDFAAVCGPSAAIFSRKTSAAEVAA